MIQVAYLKENGMVTNVMEEALSYLQTGISFKEVIS